LQHPQYWASLLEEIFFWTSTDVHVSMVLKYIFKDFTLFYPVHQTNADYPLHMSKLTMSSAPFGNVFTVPKLISESTPD
jgi:hypothetical protein